MSRKAKYATYTKYAPYIKVIMDDLDLTDKVVIDFVFGTWKKKGGDAMLYGGKVSKYDDKFHGRVRIDKTGSHAWILEALMHELMHIQQFITGRLSHKTTWISEFTKRGKKDQIPYKTWNGTLVRHHKLVYDKQGNPNTTYLNLPWEIEARDYENKVNRLRLFPNNALPVVEKRKLVGVVGKIKFYKIAA